MGHGMASFYVHAIGHLPISMLWTCTGASHRGMPRKCLMGTSVGCHPMGSPWNSIGYSLCAFHGLLLWLMLWGPTSMGFLWNCIGSSHGEGHGIVLCAIQWVFAHMHVMELQWRFSWGMPRMCSMDTSLGCPHGQPMELH